MKERKGEGKKGIKGRDRRKEKGGGAPLNGRARPSKWVKGKQTLRYWPRLDDEVAA